VRVFHTRTSLQKRIVLMVTVTTLLMLSIIMGADTMSLNNAVKQANVSQISGMTIAINGRYEESRSVQDVQQIFDYIKYKNKRVLALKLYNKEGLILASSNRNEINRSLAPDEVRLPQQDTTLVDRLPMNIRGIPTIRLIAPLLEDGNVVGAVEVLFDNAEEAALVKRRVTSNVIVGAVSAGVLLVMLWLIIRQIVIVPLTRLRQAAVLVKQGEALPRLEFVASPEIEEVSDAFNDMVTNLKERYRELQLALDTLQHTQAQLVQSEKMGALGSLVAGVSHEINTPIGIGVTAVSYLEQKTREFAELFAGGKMKKSDLEHFLSTVKETNDMVQANLQRASALIRSFKQISVDQSVEVKRTIQLSDYLREIIISLKPTIKKTKQRVTLQCPDNLTVYTYPGALSQIVTNLVMNSLNHAFAPDEEGNLMIRVQATNERIHLVYADDGRGMKQDVLDKIFDPFFTTSRARGGTGLGMNIVYNLVTQSLGGTIVCTSTVGKGTLFDIDFPKEEESAHV